ncbi:unnamed protein product [Echinostoma caproni]|uniref:Uncharacterized protein n=1 Tax=Echinostoma caproni TaxID=27848 RepID=A0A183A4X4_9TREM|nr:unnamed protein product [Echinostoma caproni]
MRRNSPMMVGIKLHRVDLDMKPGSHPKSEPLCQYESEASASSKTLAGSGDCRLECEGETTFGVVASCGGCQLRREADALSKVGAAGE